MLNRVSSSKRSLYSSLSASSTRASIQTTSTTWQDQEEFFALALYDYTPSEPGLLAFRKGEIIEIVEVEETGWWAGVHSDHVGWLPSEFVEPISDEMAEHLRSVPPELRWFEFEAENLYTRPSDSRITGQVTSFLNVAPDRHSWVPDSKSFHPEPPDDGSAISRALDKLNGASTSVNEITSNLSRLNSQGPSTRRRPMSTASGSLGIRSDGLLTGPSTSSARLSLRPTPQMLPPLMINKPTPPTPRLSEPDPYQPPASIHSVINSPRPPPIKSNTIPDPSRDLKKQHSPSTSSSSQQDIQSSPVHSSVSSRRIGWHSASDETSGSFHSFTIDAPWYLKPRHVVSALKLDALGNVRLGTEDALIEMLTLDHSKPSLETAYRKTFLTTYPSFTTTSHVLDVLIDLFEMNHPPDMTNVEFTDWKERKLRPTQKRVLTVLATWLDQLHRSEDTQAVLRRCKEFLTLIISPPPDAQIARSLLEKIENMATQSSVPSPISAIVSPKKPDKKLKLLRADFLRTDVAELVQNLTLLEFRNYGRVQPIECINWARQQTFRGGVKDLLKFCETSDRIAAWVKQSVLSSEALGRRADIINHWIRVAEKCKAVGNVSSLSALVAALESTVISQLHLTWAHVDRASHLEPLKKLADPTGNFAAYRAYLQAIEGPCVPYIGMYLTDMVHINNQHDDTIEHDDQSLINFVKCQKWADAIHAALRHQSKPYTGLTEDTVMMLYITDQLTTHITTDEAYWWARSKELQVAEVDHADMRHGLAAAGF